jgi:precorrin-6B methylase 2
MKTIQFKTLTKDKTAAPDSIKTILTLQDMIDKKISVLDPTFKAGIEKLEALAREENNEIGDSQKTTARFVFNHYETSLEKIEAAEIIKSKTGSLFSEQLKRTYICALAEAAAAGITKNSVICFVGSGYMPESAIALAAHFNCRIICLDKNEEAVKISQKVIKTLNLTRKIKIIKTNAENYDFTDNDVVWIAVMVQNKNKIIDRVYKTNPSAKIICRTVRGSRALLYEPVKEKDIETYSNIKPIFSPNPNTIMHSLILSN